MYQLHQSVPCIVTGCLIQLMERIGLLSTAMVNKTISPRACVLYNSTKILNYTGTAQL